MGWAIGNNNGRDIGYGVPAICDKPNCDTKIDRGLSYSCGGYLSDFGCGLYFCGEHLSYRKPHGSNGYLTLCPRCMQYRSPYVPKPDIPEWIEWKLTDDTWDQWRLENPKEVEKMKATLKVKAVKT